MYGKTDRRARKSRGAIFQAFESLIGEKSYSSITVGDIIERADVGRSTFYAHFQTKDSLLDELCQDIFRHVSAPQSEAEHAFSPTNPRDQLLHILHHLRAQRDRLDPLFKSPSSNLFWLSFQEALEQHFSRSVGVTIEDVADVPRGLYAHCLSVDFTEISRWWFEQALSFEPEDVLALFSKLTPVRFVGRQES